jgi:hypothetical protein
MAFQVLGTAVVIGVTYVQMTSLFMEYDLVWPVQLERFLVLLGSVVTLNVPDLMMSPDCEYAFGYAEKWFFSVASPLWMLSCFALVSAAASRCYQNKMVVEKIRDQCIQGSCIFVTLMYVSVGSARRLRRRRRSRRRRRLQPAVWSNGGVRWCRRWDVSRQCAR